MAMRARKERPPTIPPMTVEVGEPFEVGGLGVAGEVCVIHEEAVLLRLVTVAPVAVAVAKVTAVAGMEETGVSVTVLLIERKLLVGELSEFSEVMVRSDVRVLTAGELVTAGNVVGAAGSVTTEVTMSDTVTVAVNDSITSDIVTVSVVICSLDTAGDGVGGAADGMELQSSTSLHKPVSHGSWEQQPVKGPTAHL